LLRSIPIETARLLQPGERIDFRPAAGTIALDGEREIEVKTSHQVSVELSLDGPFTIDIDRAITTAAASGQFLRSSNERDTGRHTSSVAD
jgi:hypothetical protein